MFTNDSIPPLSTADSNNPTAINQDEPPLVITPSSASDSTVSEPSSELLLAHLNDRLDPNFDFSRGDEID